jgi:hypothetical protein
MRGVGLSALLALAGCSFFLDWDEELLPCDAEHQCAAGFSCLGDGCVPDHSLIEGETCNRNVQCAVEFDCTPYPYYGCRTACRDSYFAPHQNCAAGDYCRPYINGEGDRLGACVPSECTDEGDCDDGLDCIPVVTGASACLAGCEISWGGGAYSDNCGSTPLDPMYCQPIGKDDRLVCLDATNPQGVDDPCQPIEQPCARGFVCEPSLDVCKLYCNHAGVASCGDCTPVLDGDDYGFCP